MTKLQELMLQRKRLADQQKEAFGKYEDDLSKMPNDEQKAATARNAEIVELDAQIERLTRLEEMKRVAVTEHRHQADENSRAQHESESKALTRTREVERVKTLPRFGKVKNFKGPDAELKAYQFGMWFAGTVLKDKYENSLTRKAEQYCLDWGLNTKAQSEGINTAGGYLVPNQFANDIIDLREEFGVFRANTRVMPMLRETMTIPRRVSGLTVFYPGEGIAVTESNKGWDMITLTVRKYACLTLYSSELFEDAMISIGDDLASEIAYAFALAEDTNGFNGDGTSTFGGTAGVRTRLFDVYGASGGVGLKLATGSGSGNNWDTGITLQDFEAVLGSLPIYARRNARWFCSAVFFHTVMHKLQLAAGGNSAIDIANGGTYRFLGMPVVESQVFPTTAALSQVPVVFGDLGLGSKLGDRRELTIAFSDQYKFAEDQLAIKGTQRIDIVVHDVGNASTPGPIVGLVTKAS